MLIFNRKIENVQIYYPFLKCYLFMCNNEKSSEISHQDFNNRMFYWFQNCWNCGRKANETCSGCNVARYCGSFCQHKDWESHHRVCGQSSSNHPATSSSSTPPRTNSDHSPSPSRTSTLVDIKPIKIDTMWWVDTFIDWNNHEAICAIFFLNLC